MPYIGMQPPDLLKKPQGVGWRLNPNHPLNQGLVAWWLMNEGAGNKIINVANGNGSTLNNQNWEVGSGGIRIKSGAGSTLWSNLGVFAGTVFTILFNIKTVSDVSSRQFLLGDVASSGGLGLELSNPVLYGFDLCSVAVGPITAGSVIAPGSSDCIVCVSIGGNSTGAPVRWYLGGKLVATENTTGGWIAEHAFQLNGRSGASVELPFLGSFITVSIWNRVLTDSQVYEASLLSYGTPDSPRLLFPSTRKWFVPSGAVPGYLTKLKTLQGLSKADIKTIQGLALGSIKTIHGLD